MLLLLLACTDSKSPFEMLETRCRYFDSMATDRLAGYSMHSLRSRYPHGSFQVKRIGDKYDYAIIRFRPQQEVEKNFRFSDTIDLAFVDMLASLECNGFYCDTAFSSMHLFLKDSSYFLFKGFPPGKVLLGGLDPARAKPLQDDWRYFCFALKPG